MAMFCVSACGLISALAGSESVDKIDEQRPAQQPFGQPGSGG